MNFFYCCGVIPSFLSCSPWAAVFMKSHFPPFWASAQFSQHLSFQQVSLCVSPSLHEHTPPQSLFTSSSLGPRNGDCGSPLLASIPHQSGCSPWVPASPQSRPATVPGMWGKMLLTSGCVPRRTPLILGAGGWQRIFAEKWKWWCLPSEHT